ncbi:tenascin-like isoform X2 [Ceratina calcarata]|uniref:Tenascin-like isoform X2 n=1 Tax=Ceratina calcarata TaxID=156304 RepID=A0AAJ7JCC4_9HYME|nr:tenascin-like isoform X2 [Ceratina calcarata]
MNYLRIFVFVNAILLVEGTSQSSSEDTRNKCLVHYSRKQMVYVPYFETYKIRKWGIFYQIKERMNYKIEYKTIWVDEMDCCTGYQQVGGRVCKPRCSTSCVNAICTKPDTCECKPGFRPSLEPGRQEYVCDPLCDGDCPNGTCVAPNQCKCDRGYSLLDDLHCQPICNINCEQYNARCTAPNQCQCKEGYLDESASNNSSTPVCTPICNDCKNSTCTAPQVCTCNDGFEHAGEFGCKPQCEKGCLNGNCIAPNTCVCDLGYQLNHNECKPVCSQPCKKGTCIAPEVCSCDEGYGLRELIGDARYICEPVCERACVNGTCTAPNNCTCYEGYRVSGDDTMIHVCLPDCGSSCENGECIAPGVCRCNEGYTMHNCYNGTRESETKMCSPCKLPCETAGTLCVAPGVCDKFDMGDNATWHCESICDPACINGRCIRPNICLCNNDYVHTKQGVCEPICSSCDNGTCIAPNVCQCKKGFVLLNVSCVPHCENCENGDCVAPDVCQCHNGFQSDGNVSVCYAMYNSTDAVSRLAGTLAAVTILLMAIASAVIYLLIRRHQRRRIGAVRSAVQESIATESLLEEEDHITSPTMDLYGAGS